MRYTYLLLNVFTISIPLLRSFESRIYFFGKWKHYLPANLFTAIFFLVWDYLKTVNGVWRFSPDYTLGHNVIGLPIEEILFFITVPYACVFIYETVCLFVHKQYLSKNINQIMFWLGALLLITSTVFTHKAYTFTVLSIGGVVFMLAAKCMSAEFIERFLMMYGISIIPMLLVNGVLTALPVVIYNNQHNLGLRVGTIPVEDFLYSAILLMMNTGLYVWFRQRSAPHHSATIVTTV